MAEASLTDAKKYRILEHVLALFQFLGLVSLFLCFVGMAFANMGGPLTFASNPVRAAVIYGYPLVLICTVIVGWILFRRRKIWAAFIVTLVPLVLFAFVVLIYWTGWWIFV